MSIFNAQSSTDEVIKGISLKGRQAVVTGASSGLGLETARALAAAGASVLMLGRSREKLDAASKTITAEFPGANVATGKLDLADLDSVRAAATNILARTDRVDLLINNAGVMVCPLDRTAQGFEMQFGTNHLGHFLLTCLLAPALIKAAPARVIMLSSGAHKLAPCNLDDPAYLSRPYDKWQAYGESKSANSLFAVALDRRLKSQGVRVNAVHPGIIITDLGRHMAPADIEHMASLAPPGSKMQFKSIAQGAATSIWAAVSPALEDIGGQYLEDCTIAAPAVAGTDGGVESYALEPGSADRLWGISEQLVGQAFSFQSHD